MQSIDTNILVRLLLNDVPTKAKSIQQMLGQSKPNSFSVDDVVFFELVWVLSGEPFKFSRADIADMLAHIVQIPQISCNQTLLERALPIYIKTLGLSFVDICLAVYADLNNAKPLLTYDKNLAIKLPEYTKLLT